MSVFSQLELRDLISLTSHQPLLPDELVALVALPKATPLITFLAQHALRRGHHVEPEERLSYDLAMDKNLIPAILPPDLASSYRTPSELSSQTVPLLNKIRLFQQSIHLLQQRLSIVQTESHAIVESQKRIIDQAEEAEQHLSSIHEDLAVLSSRIALLLSSPAHLPSHIPPSPLPLNELQALSEALADLTSSLLFHTSPPRISPPPWLPAEVARLDALQLEDVYLNSVLDDLEAEEEWESVLPEEQYTLKSLVESTWVLDCTHEIDAIEAALQKAREVLEAGVLPVLLLLARGLHADVTGEVERNSLLVVLKEALDTVCWTPEGGGEPGDEAIKGNEAEVWDSLLLSLLRATSSTTTTSSPSLSSLWTTSSSNRSDRLATHTSIPLSSSSRLAHMTHALQLARDMTCVGAELTRLWREVEVKNRELEGLISKGQKAGAVSEGEKRVLGKFVASASGAGGP